MHLVNRSKTPVVLALHHGPIHNPSPNRIQRLRQVGRNDLPAKLFEVELAAVMGAEKGDVTDLGRTEIEGLGSALANLHMFGTEADFDGFSRFGDVSVSSAGDEHPGSTPKSDSPSPSLS